MTHLDPYTTFFALFLLAGLAGGIVERLTRNRPDRPRDSQAASKMAYGTEFDRRAGEGS